MKTNLELLELLLEVLKNRKSPKHTSHRTIDFKFGLCRVIDRLKSIFFINQQEADNIYRYLHDHKPEFDYKLWGSNFTYKMLDYNSGFFFPLMDRGEEFVEMRITYLENLIKNYHDSRD